MAFRFFVPGQSLLNTLFSIRKTLGHFLGRELDQELREPFNESDHHLPSLFGRRRVRVAAAGVGGQQVPGPGDRYPAAVDCFEAGFGRRAASDALLASISACGVNG